MQLRSDIRMRESFAPLQAHSNANEYIPISLLLLALLEGQAIAPGYVLHTFGKSTTRHACRLVL